MAMQSMFLEASILKSNSFNKNYRTLENFNYSIDWLGMQMLKLHSDIKEEDYSYRATDHVWLLNN